MSGGERAKYGLEVTDRIFFAANHQAVAALQAPDTATGADIEIAYVLLFQIFGTTHIVGKIGVSTVDDDVAVAEQARELLDDIIDDLVGHHDPYCPGWLQALHQGFNGIGGICTECRHLVPGAPGACVDDATMIVGQQSLDHVGAHAPQADHSNLHVYSEIS